MRRDNFTDAAFADFDGIVRETVNKLIKCADKHNIDRDDFIKYFAAIFNTMAEISTFKYYESEGATND